MASLRKPLGLLLIKKPQKGLLRFSLTAWQLLYPGISGQVALRPKVALSLPFSFGIFTNCQSSLFTSNQSITHNFPLSRATGMMSIHKRWVFV